MANPSHDPNAEIEADNPWYVDDQFAAQCGAPGPRAVLEKRWRTFRQAIDEWSRSRTEPPRRILDAGCGDGINLDFLQRICSERAWPTIVVGADYNALRVGRARQVDSCTLMRASVTALGFKDEAFDLVLCNQVLEHVPGDAVAFREIQRVLRPGGLCLVGVPNEGSLMGTLRNHVLQRSVLRSTDHVNMYTDRILRRRLNDAGLDVRRIEHEGFFVPHTSAHALLSSLPPVRGALTGLAQLFPGFAAGLIAIAGRPL